MNFPKNAKKYDRIEFTNLLTDKAFSIIRPDGGVDKVKPFIYQPTKFSYDPHGYEILADDGKPEIRARYTPQWWANIRWVMKNFLLPTRIIPDL